MDNLPAHEAAGVRNAAEAAGASEIQRYSREARFRPVSVPETYGDRVKTIEVERTRL